MTFTLQILPPDMTAFVTSASNVQPGDNSGYTYVVVVLATMLGLSLFAIGRLYLENKTLQTAAVTRAEESTKALIEALNAVKEQYRELTRTQGIMNDLLKELRHKM